jgi:hypothetical protein
MRAATVSTFNAPDQVWKSAQPNAGEPLRFLGSSYLIADERTSAACYLRETLATCSVRWCSCDDPRSSTCTVRSSAIGKVPQAAGALAQ